MGCSFASLFLESLLLVLLHGTTDLGNWGCGANVITSTLHVSKECGLCFQETLNNSSRTLEAPVDNWLSFAGVICPRYWQHLLQQVLIKKTQAFPAQTLIHTAFCGLHNALYLTLSRRANEIVESGKCAGVNSPRRPGYQLTPAHVIEPCLWFIVSMLMCTWPFSEVKCATENSMKMFWEYNMGKYKIMDDEGGWGEVWDMV